MTEMSKSITIPDGRVECPVITMCCSALNLAITPNKIYRLLNPLNAELNPIRHLLALVGARHIVHVNRIRVNTRKFEWKGTVSRVRKEIVTSHFWLPDVCLSVSLFVRKS